MGKNIRVKPGKTQSMFGAIVGLVFVLIGLIVVIPTFGPFGIFWTLVAIAICGMNLYNATSDKGLATHEIVVEDGKDAKSRMEEVENLYNAGLITREEYEKKRQEILDTL